MRLSSLLLISLVVGCSSSLESAPVDSGTGGSDSSTPFDSGPPRDMGPGIDSSTPNVDAGPVTDPALHTESEVCARWNADRADNFEGTWSGDGTCAPGDMEMTWRDRTLKQINLYRWLAGLPAVTFEATRNQKAQECARLQSANPGLEHEPPMTYACWTENAYEGSSHSNIASSAAVHAIDQYMVDWGASNLVSLGHRRWILDNSVGPFGVGSTNTKSCLWVIGGSGGADYDYVMWPPPGPVPLEAFYIANFGSGRDLGLRDSAWSIQSETIMFTDETVATVSEDGVELPVRAYRLGQGYGTRYGLGIEPLDWDVDPGHTYHVQVTGDTLPAPIVYDVQVVGCGTTIGMPDDS